MADGRSLAPVGRAERVQRAYLWAVPWAGYLALLAVARPLAMPAILTGWVLILVWQIFAVGAFDAGISAARRNPLRLAWMLAPILLFATQSWGAAGLALANALIELTIVEVAALILTLVVVMILQPGMDKGPAWPGIVIMGIFVIAFLSAFAGAWLQLNAHPGWLRLGTLALAFASQCVVDWAWLRRLADKGLRIDDPFSGNRGFALIIGQLLAWLLLPAVFALIAML